MRRYETERKALTQIRAYLSNGFPIDYKPRLIGMQRRIELKLDRAKRQLEYSPN